MKELLTTSRITKFLTCPRAHYWSYEKQLRRLADTNALRFGTAWHLAMEARSKGHDAYECLSLSLPETTHLDAIQAETLASLLLAYFERYGKIDIHIQYSIAEVQFKNSIKRSKVFYEAGKIDGVSVLHDERMAITEHKTTGDDIGPDSNYWTRLRFNPQLLQYVGAARRQGWNIHTAIYDVVRKPSIKPKQIPLLDDQGRKVVNDASGNRVFKKDGSPRESADASLGYELQSRVETPEEFGQRLYEDAKARPDFYFARREVPILDQDVAEFEVQRLQVSRMILTCRSEQKKVASEHQAWPRNVGMACDFCEYSSFCLQNITPPLSEPPAGFVVSTTQHTELNADTVGTTTTN